MAGLSSITAITRPLGEVDLAAMNRCTGVYRVYLIGGGGGGGGYDDFYGWYGAAGGEGFTSTYTGSLVPPITISGGAGGWPGEVNVGESGRGSDATLRDKRASIKSASGGMGGESAYDHRAIWEENPTIMTYTEPQRFDISIFYRPPTPPYTEIEVGRGGYATEYGVEGGIIKAFRIG